MSSRVRSELGTLGVRAGAGVPPRTAHVEVLDGEARCPGVLVGWQRGPDGWLAHAAWVRDGELVVGLVAAARVRPHGAPGEA